MKILFSAAVASVLFGAAILIACGDSGNATQRSTRAAMRPLRTAASPMRRPRGRRSTAPPRM
jgi:hypothetical protein